MVTVVTVVVEALWALEVVEEDQLLVGRGHISMVGAANLRWAPKHRVPLIALLVTNRQPRKLHRCL